jgi:hypothetical protein
MRALRLAGRLLTAAAFALPAARAGCAGIEWDTGTLTLIQEGGGYGRIVRLKDGGLICSHELHGRAQVRRSRDEGRSWGAAVVAASWEHGAAANPELLQLRDGALLCLFNQRPHNPPPGGQTSATTRRAGHTFGIALARSDDGGRSWDAPRRLYAAGTNPDEGCWEPAGIQLPSGEIQVYFANEAPYRTTDEQEISLMRSRDGGATWSAPQCVSRRHGQRDGMPSPLVLPEGEGIVVAIEDNWQGNHFLKPAVVFSTLAGNWDAGPVGGDSPNRWLALRDPLPERTYAGAPCLRQMPSGATVLSFQRNDTGELPGSRMAVCLGDPHARNFALQTHPFPQAPGTTQYWNSLFVKDSDTVTAVSGTVINGVAGLWAVDGKVRE